MSSTSINLRSRRPGSAPSSINAGVDAAASLLSSSSTSQRRGVVRNGDGDGGDGGTPSYASAKERRSSGRWYLVLLAAAILLSGLVARGVILFTKKRPGGKPGSSRGAGAGGGLNLVRRLGGRGVGAVRDEQHDAAHAEVKAKVDAALLEASHGQRKGRIDAALRAANGAAAASAAADPVDDPDNLTDHLGSRLHVVFSTDCGTFQHWQSYLLFHSALKVGQPGHVTRIASGCTDSEAVEARRWFEEHVRPMSARFGLHLTPHFSGLKDDEGRDTGKTYKFFNKPFGLRHWLENGEGMGLDSKTGAVVDPDVVVVLVDPDMLLLRPITTDFSVDREVVLGRKPAKDAEKGHRYMKVEKGKPFGQTYGFGNQWKKHLDIAKIAGRDSPAITVDWAFAQLHYPVGPPYMAAAADMHAIAVGWTDFAPGVHRQYPNLLAEMFAYCLAAAHVELPHQRIDSLMISSPGGSGEGWELIEKIPDEEICGFAARPDHAKHALPNVLHFCQRYGIGPYFFGKRRVPHDIFTCDSPLMAVPEPDAGSRYDYRVAPGGRGAKARVALDGNRRKHEAFAACAAISAVNDAAAYFKRRHCGDGANWEASLDMGSNTGRTTKELKEEEEEEEQRKGLAGEGE